MEAIRVHEPPDPAMTPDAGPAADEPDGGAGAGGGGGGFRHGAMFYDTPADYRSAVLRFVRDGLSRAEPVLVAVPGPAGALVREGLNGEATEVTFADMTRLGLNPARIIAAIWDFIERNHGRQVRFVTEPAWPGRSAAEAREVAVHEAMVNLAFAAAPVSVMCPYDTGRLAPVVTQRAACTHPVILTSQGARPSTDYAAGRAPRAATRPLPDPPGRAERLPYTTDLRAVRQFVAAWAARAGLGTDRVGDLVLAVGEVAANTVRHSPDGGIAHIWRSRAEVICQVTDNGRIGDPLAGRRRPPGPSGLGLWVVHQVCDLVEMRTGRRGTTVRMHMALPS
jgi:anti-sigma regulatory factor (Ser/Thr protein kinase)